jgi:YD repeat-containing protein
MKRKMMLLAAALLPLLSAGDAMEVPSPATETVVAAPGWIRQAPPAATPAEARARWAAAGSSPLALSPVEETSEIVELARALRNDPRRIFDYVRNRIDYEPTYGSVLGARATYYAGTGNDCDQASLLIALLRQAGFQARYAIGDVTYTPARLGAWLGADAGVAQNVLLNGGVPLVWGGTGWQIARVWVEAYLDGGWVTLDPAMKAYDAIAPGVTNWNAAMNHVPSAFLTRAQAGATVDAHSAKNLNETNIRADLSGCSTSLVNHIRANLPAAGFAEFVGGRRIVEVELGAYPTVLPFAVSVANQATYDTLPAGLSHTLTVTHVQTPANTHTFDTVDLAGRRLTLFFNGANTVLALEGVPVFIFTGTPSNAAFTVRVQLQHPCGIAQMHEFPLTSGAFSYALACDFDGVSPELLAMRRERLERARQQGAAGSEAVRGEALSILGLEWFRQVALFDKVVDALNRTRSISHHRVGMVGQGPGFYVDMPLMYGSTASTDGSSDIWLSSRAQTLMSSAFEHGVLQQRQDHSGWDSVSTVRLLQYGNETGGATYLANAANWNTGYNVRAKLFNYSAGTLSWLDAIVAAGYDLVLPQNGQLQVGSWRGTGFVQHYLSGGAFGMGMIISGGYAGGYTANPAVLDPGQAKWAEGYEPWQPQTPTSKDPVDMATGAFLYEMGDFSVGPAAEPLGLALSRAYSSAASLKGGSLGYGWAHNHMQAAVVHSSGAGGLGCGGAVNAASAVASARILLDLLAGTPNALAWSTASLVSKWTMDTLIDNAVTVHAAAATDTFLKLADGSFNPPPGGDGVLVVSGSGFALKDRQGTVRTFGASGAISAWSDPNGNAMTYAYDGSSRLTSVTDCLGKTLSFSYNGSGLLTNASHGGRSAQYSYAGGNLVNFRDAAGVDWRYAYDGSNRLAAVFKALPSSVAHVTNVYDSFGRVETQNDARGNASAFYLSGYRNVEAFPDGSQMVYIFGRDRLFTAREDAVGNRATFDYDGLGRLIRMTDRLGDETVFVYHPAIARVVEVTNAGGDATSFTYGKRPSNPLCYDLVRVDYPGGGYETFGYDAAGNATAHRDASGSNWAATYNARGQRLSLTNSEGGVETRVYHADGTMTSVKDSDVPAVTLQYDAFKRLSRITHAGGAYEQFVRDALGRATSYADAEGRTTALQYDANGRLSRLTDPSARATSFAYDTMDNLVAITNRLGAVTAFAYDTLNRRVGKTDATGVETTFAYDPRGRLATMTRGGRVWKTVHDDEGVLGGLVTPDAATNSVATDRLGMVTGWSDALGQSSTYTRDAAGWITAVIDPCGRTNGYAADGAGRLTRVTLPSRDAATYANDSNGFLEQVTDLNGQQWNLTRTAMGRRLSLSDPLARVCSYGYDTRGRLAAIAYPDDSSLAVTLDGVGNTRRLLHSDGPDLPFGYDANHRLTSADGVVLGRDHEGRIVSTTDGTEVCGAAYDAAGRLTAARCDGGAFAVTYAYATGPGGSGLLTGVWDNVSSARVSFAYDAAGRCSRERARTRRTRTDEQSLRKRDRLRTAPDEASHDCSCINHPVNRVILPVIG